MASLQNGQGLDDSPNVKAALGTIVKNFNTSQVDISGKLFSGSSGASRSLGKQNDANDSLPVANADKAWTKENKVSWTMAYASWLAFFAYNKPHDLSPTNLVGVTEYFTDKTAVEHFQSEALEKCLDQVLKIRITNVDVDGVQGDIKALPQGVETVVVFTHKKSTVRLNIIEDMSKPADSRDHYLLIRKARDGIQDPNVTVHGNIAAKDPYAANASDQGGFTKGKVVYQGKFAKSSENSDQQGNRSGGDQTDQAVHNLEIEETLKGKKITVTCSLTVVTVENFCKNLTTSDSLSADNYTLEPAFIEDGAFKKLFEELNLEPNGMYPIAYIDQHTTATQLRKNDISACDRFGSSGTTVKKVLVIAFPGTDSFEDLEEDKDTSEKNALVELGGITTSLNFALKWKSDTSNSTAEVHKGYKRAYLSVRDALLETVYSITDEWSKQWHIIVTGHLLGGSLCTLAAYDIANREKDDDGDQGNPELAMFTFAAPAVGNEDMAAKFGVAVPFGFRVVADDDEVADTLQEPLHRLGHATPWDNTPKQRDVTKNNGWNAVIDFKPSQYAGHIPPNYLTVIRKYFGL